LNAKGCAEAYDKQIETIIEDDLALSDAYLNRATIALDTKDYDRVRDLCGRIIKLKVREGDAWHVLAMLAYRESKHEEAISLFDVALERGCRNQPLTHWNKSLPLHAIGRYREGWEEHNWGQAGDHRPGDLHPAPPFHVA
jgi:tetratricopeptide (TPR) repeat protein